MKNLDQAVKDLEKIVSFNIQKYVIPEAKGNSIKIGDVVIRKSNKHGFVVIDTRTNKSITTTHSKNGAVAIALAYRKNKDFKTLEVFDNIIGKNENDCTFYEHVIENNPDQTKKYALLNRLEVAAQRAEWARSCLDDYIMKDIR